MLNPSTADAYKSDPTVTRCIRFSRSWGFGRLEVVNIFGFRPTDSDALCADTENEHSTRKYEIYKQIQTLEQKPPPRILDKCRSEPPGGGTPYCVGRPRGPSYLPSFGYDAGHYKNRC
jgi:hypothetical protein